MKNSLFINFVLMSLFSLFLLLSCKLATKPTTEDVVEKETKLFYEIHIVPLGNVNKQTIVIVANGIEKFYGVTPVIENSVPLTKDLLAKSGTRYDGNKILGKFKSNRYQLFVTEKDIAIKYPFRHSDEWGILGLSNCPGHIAVVSTFRIKKYSNLFDIRLQKVCNHELGHCLGLKHCNASPTCLMNDARGTMKQIDMEEMKFCVECEKKLP
jgi:archaemetzincin